MVGVGEPFHILDRETVQQLIDAFEIVKEEEAPPAEPEPEADQGATAEGGSGADQGAPADQGVAPMDI